MIQFLILIAVPAFCLFRFIYSFGLIVKLSECVENEPWCNDGQLFSKAMISIVMKPANWYLWSVDAWVTFLKSGMKHEKKFERYAMLTGYLDVASIILLWVLVCAAIF